MKLGGLSPSLIFRAGCLPVYLPFFSVEGLADSPLDVMRHIFMFVHDPFVAILLGKPRKTSTIPCYPHTRNGVWRICNDMLRKLTCPIGGVQPQARR